MKRILIIMVGAVMMSYNSFGQTRGSDSIPNKNNPELTPGTNAPVFNPSNTVITPDVSPSLTPNTPGVIPNSPNLIPNNTPVIPDITPTLPSIPNTLSLIHI